MLDRVNRGMHRTREFLTTDLWTLDTRRFSLRGRAALNTLKVIYIVCRGFIHDRCALQAASLTFMTLMCLVPLLALVLLVARALQFDQALQTWLQTSAHQHVPSHIQPLLTQILELVKTTNLLALGSVGCLLILALLIRVMTRIEHTLNAVWGVREGRRLTRRLPEYLSIFFIVPFLLLLATSVNTMLASDAITDWLQGALARILPNADEVAVQSNYPFWVAYFTIYELILRVVGWCGLVGGLLFLYLWMPNTNVKFRSALIGAVCATVMWLLWQRDRKSVV